MVHAYQIYSTVNYYRAWARNWYEPNIIIKLLHHYSKQLCFIGGLQLPLIFWGLKNLSCICCQIIILLPFAERLYCTVLYSTVDHPPFYNDCAHNSLTVQYRELQHWYCAIPGLYPDCEISVAMLEPIAICSVDLGYSTLPEASFSKPLKGDKSLCITLIWRREQRTV